MTRRAFTLLETVLATMIGGMVVLACVGLFTAVSRADGAFASRAASVTEFATAQRTLRRALLGLVMMPASERPDPRQVEEALANGEPPPSPDEWPMPRFIIETDESPAIRSMLAAAAIDGVQLLPPSMLDGQAAAGVQRLELVLTEPPLPPALATAGKSWARISVADAMVGATVGVAETGEVLDPGLRSVFELRPDGFRERIIAGFGITPASAVRGQTVDAETGRRFAPRELEAPAEGWTLWWRPVYSEERAARDAGTVFDVDARPELLIEAVPIVRSLVEFRATAFALDREQGVGIRFDDFIAHASRDLPGYVEIEARGANGHYANWMFEVGWQIADEGGASIDDGTGGDPDDPSTDLNTDGVGEGDAQNAGDAIRDALGGLGAPRGTGSGQPSRTVGEREGSP